MSKYFAILLVFCLSLLGISIKSHAAAPVIFPVASTTGVTVAYVVWYTDIASDSRVDYGPTTGYGSNVTDSTSVTMHKLTISNLSPNTTYHFKVTSSGTVSKDYTFTTYANPTGTVRTVGSGKTYATLSACAAAAQPGDTCLVYAGTYAPFSAVRNGSPGSPITFLAQEAASVGGFSMGGYTYQSLKGFEVTGGITGSSSHNATIESNYLHPAGTAIRIPDGSDANDVTIRNNVVDLGNTNAACLYVFGNRLLIDGNTIGRGADFIDTGGVAGGGASTGQNIVVRNNILHHADHALIGGSEHIDGIQIIGSMNIGYSLFEGNIEYSCSDTTGNCHYIQARAPSTAGGNLDTVIIRYGYANKISGACLGLGDHNDASVLQNWMVYNNTCATEQLDAANGSGWGLDAPAGATNTSTAYNNIFYKTSANGWSPTYSVGGIEGSNIVYNPGYSGAWNSPYSGESTYNSLKNANPLFANYPYDASIQAGSPAKATGRALTTVAAGDSGSGTSLVVSNARFFQPGWARTQADWIAVGTVSNTVQISSINYATNTITLANSITRSNGQSVWLYKKSDGVTVLNGTGPDIGASYDGILGAPAPVQNPAPRNLMSN